LENFLKVITPANKKAWEDLKVHMIGMIIVDEIVKLKQIGMHVFAFSKLACEYFPKYLRLAQELVVKEASVILGRRVKYDILFHSEKTGELPSVGGNIKCGNTELQHVCTADSLFLLIIVLDWTEQLNLCANTFSLANVSRIFSQFLQSMAITESELRKLRKDQWDERSDECKLQWREDAKRRWDERSDE
jgi:hypothetical protein